MNKEVNDQVFGRMIYKHRWIKNEAIDFWNQTYDVTIAAKAYSNKPITNEQRESYNYFKKNISSLSEETAELVYNYINNNSDELCAEWMKGKRVSSTSDFKNIVFPKTVLFKPDGIVIILCDCVFDIEHGLGIEVYPSLKIGSQDLFL